jgi:TonB family protein
MIRERTHLNLAIGVSCSLLLHVWLVLWGPPFSLPVFIPRESTRIDVQLWELPPPSVEPPAAPLKVEELPPTRPMPLPREQPVAPADRTALQEAVREASADVRPDRMEIRLPERPSPVTGLESSVDRLPIAQSLLDSLQREPRVVEPPPTSRLPEPTRTLSDRKEVPPLPALGRYPRREAIATTPPAVARPGPYPTAHIKGPAAERRVIFQPPPPSTTVESETEIELRFWILPNGTVSRVIPMKKSDPRLEALAINYLRNWRFNPLPTDAEPVEQWGVIPFKFVIR